MTAIWQKRIAAWRASGESGAAFSARNGFPVSALWRWSSKFKRESAPSAPPAPMVRLAQLVRTPGAEIWRRGAVVIDLADVRARITVEPGVDRDTLAMVVGVVAGVSR